MGCALTCFQQDDLIVLAQVHEAGDAFGEFHHILDGISDVVRALLPHPLSRLGRAAQKSARYRDVIALDSSWRRWSAVWCRLQTLFWNTRVSSGVYCTQVNLFMSSALY